MAKIVLDKEPTFTQDDWCPFNKGNDFCMLKASFYTETGFSWEDPQVSYHQCSVRSSYTKSIDFSKCPYCTVLNK